MPCSCYNSSAANDSATFDKVFFSQLSRLGPRARPRHSADLCVVPANDHIYHEVGRIGANAGKDLGPA